MTVLVARTRSAFSPIYTKAQSVKLRLTLRYFRYSVITFCGIVHSSAYAERRRMKISFLLTRSITSISPILEYKGYTYTITALQRLLFSLFLLSFSLTSIMYYCNTPLGIPRNRRLHRLTILAGSILIYFYYR